MAQTTLFPLVWVPKGWEEELLQQWVDEGIFILEENPDEPENPFVLLTETGLQWKRAVE